MLSEKSKNFWQKSDQNQSEWNQSEGNQSEGNQSLRNQNFLKSPRAPWSYFFRFFWAGRALTSVLDPLHGRQTVPSTRREESLQNPCRGVPTGNNTLADGISTKVAEGKWGVCWAPQGPGRAPALELTDSGASFILVWRVPWWMVGFPEFLWRNQRLLHGLMRVPVRTQNLVASAYALSPMGPTSPLRTKLWNGNSFALQRQNCCHCFGEGRRSLCLRRVLRQGGVCDVASALWLRLQPTQCQLHDHVLPACPGLLHTGVNCGEWVSFVLRWEPFDLWGEQGQGRIIFRRRCEICCLILVNSSWSWSCFPFRDKSGCVRLFGKRTRPLYEYYSAGVSNFQSWTQQTMRIGHPVRCCLRTWVKICCYGFCCHSFWCYSLCSCGFWCWCLPCAMQDSPAAACAC